MLSRLCGAADLIKVRAVRCRKDHDVDIGIGKHFIKAVRGLRANLGSLLGEDDDICATRFLLLFPAIDLARICPHQPKPAKPAAIITIPLICREKL